MKPRFWMNSFPFMDDRPDNAVYSFALADGRTVSGQVVESEITRKMDGEIYILPIREGASNNVTYIPWRAVMTFKSLT